LNTIGYTSAISSKLDGARFAQCLRSNVFLPCAYHRTTAVLTCLHIPMQLNIAYFPFPVLAPLLPAAPLPPARVVNADKRYPRPWPPPTRSRSGFVRLNIFSNAKIVQTSAEPSWLELCRVQPIFAFRCKDMNYFRNLQVFETNFVFFLCAFDIFVYICSIFLKDCKQY